MKVVNKGYTLIITSWENDGDDYRTKYYTVPTLEEAKALYTICTILFKSYNNREGGIGKSTSSKRLKEIIIDFYNKYKELFTNLVESEEDFINYCNGYAYILMGSSEYYHYRVCESCKIFYSPEDIYCKDITFD